MDFLGTTSFSGQKSLLLNSSGIKQRREEAKTWTFIQLQPGRRKAKLGGPNFAGTKDTVEAITAIIKTSSELEYDKRMGVFDRLMLQIQDIYILHQHGVLDVPTLRCAHQLEYLTGCADLTAAVRQNLFLQLGGLFYMFLF